MKRNYLIEALRGILIIWIILFHYTVRYEELFKTRWDIVHFENGGDIGVLMFFVISGYFFFRSYTSVSDFGIKPFAKFIINKYWRLWPTYIISVTITFTIVKLFSIGWGGREASLIDLIGNIFIIHPGFKFVDGAHWFLSALIIAQCINSFGIICRKIKDVWTDFSMILVLTTFILSQYTDIRIFDMICTHFYCKDVLMFLVGIYLWQWLNQESKKGLIMSLLLSIYFSVLYHTLLVAIYVFLFIFLAINEEYSNRVPRFAIYIGEVSFCWYLIHQNIGYIIIGLFEIPYMGIACAIIVSFVLASLLYYATKKIPQKLFT